MTDYDTHKYPAHSVPNTTPTTGGPSFLRGFAVGILVLVIWSLSLLALANAPGEPVPAGAVVGAQLVTNDNKSVNMQNYIDTSTPAPTYTAQPSVTPYPTITHTSAPVQVEHTPVPQVHITQRVIIKVITATSAPPLEIIRFVTVIVTSSPEPKPTHTQRPTQTPTGTPDEDAIQAAHAAAIKRTRDTQNTWLRGFAFYVVIPFAVFAFAVWLGWRWFKSRDALLEQQGAETHVDDIQNRTNSIQDIPINDWREKQKGPAPTPTEAARIAAYMLGGEMTRSAIALAVYNNSGSNYLPKVDYIGFELVRQGILRRYPPEDGEKVE